jgi:hypothetical protein
MSPTLDDALEGYRTHCRVILSRSPMAVYAGPQRRRRRSCRLDCHIVPSRPTTRPIHPRPARRAAKDCPGYRLRTEEEIPTLKRSPQRTRMEPAPAAAVAAAALTIIVVVVVEPPPQPPQPDDRRGNEALDPVVPPAAVETNATNETTTARQRRGTVYRHQNCKTCAIKKEG